MLGIGLNVSTRDVPGRAGRHATSLRVAGVESTTADVLDDVLRVLDAWLGAPPTRCWPPGASATH